MTQINLAWAASTPSSPYSNFGDALNPVLLHLLTGRSVLHSNFDSAENKLVAIGTILQDFRNGSIQVWGTGLDARVSASISEKRHFDPRITNVNYNIHAVRGIMTAHSLRAFGIDVPEVYGDPAILLRTILRTYVKGNKEDRIGLVCHLSELKSYDNLSEVREDINLYKLSSDEAKIISPITSPNAMAVLKKVKEIASYNYILSRSLHGLIIADIFDIPCAYFTSGDFKSGVYSIFDSTVDIDHRFRDYYSGLGRTTVPVYVCPEKGINVSEVKEFLARNWEPYSNWNSIGEKLIKALPFPVTGYSDHAELPLSLNLIKL